MKALKKIRFGFAVNAQIAFWISLYIFMFYVSSVTMGLYTAASRATLVSVCHLANFYAVFSFLTPQYFEKKRYLAFSISVILLLLVLTPVRLLLENAFILEFPLYDTHKGMKGLALFSEIAITAFATLLRIAISSNETKRQITEMEKLNLETELKFLKSQMSPHFLFNSINNVYALSLGKSDKAPAALLKLSGLLRYLLYECNHKVTFCKELEALESYIELFQLRYEEPLDISLRSTVEHVQPAIEPMLLIPLLENALKHSGIGVVAGAFVAIRLSEKDGMLIASIVNSKSTLSVDKDEASGIGLANIRKRLTMIQRENPGPDIRETANSFEITVKIPIA